MNANELADKCGLMIEDYDFGIEVATMLRQQQAEIEALKAGKIRAYDNGVEDGRKHNTNNEPVAWIKQSKYGKPIIVQNPCYQLSYQAECAKWNDIPLYTHPAKTLTDEEIVEIAKDCGYANWYELNIKFARAILKKANEK